MQFFIDSADIDSIRKAAQMGLADGVTTNPSLIARAGGDIFATLKDICAAVPGPVSAEVVATDTEGMLAEGRKLAKIAKNIVVKTPLTPDGLRACRILTDEGTRVNITLCFSVAQALLAAKAGAAFVSPFIGRLDDIGLDGTELLHDIRTVYANYPAFETQILAASIRSVNHLRDAALAGADCATIPPDVLFALVKHPLTDKGLAAFLADWKKTGQKIL